MHEKTYREGREDERAALLAWLRDTTKRRSQFRYPFVKDLSDCCRQIADCLEREEHVKP